MSAGALSRDLDSGGIAAWVRARPIAVAARRGRDARAILVLGVGSRLGQDRNRRGRRRDPVEDARARHRRHLVAGDRGDRLGAAVAARPHVDGRRLRPGDRRRDIPGAAPQSAGRSLRARDGVRCRARSRDRRAPADPSGGHRVRPPAWLRLRRRADLRVAGLPSRRDRWARRPHSPAAHRLRGRLRARRHADDGDVRVGRGAASDLLVPTRGPRRERRGCDCSSRRR